MSSGLALEAEGGGWKRYPVYKDSGVEWLGDVPEGWELLRIKQLAQRIQTGSTPPTQELHYYENGSIPWFGPGSFGTDLVLDKAVKLISKTAVKDGVARIFKGQSTMIVTIGATIGKVGYIESSASSNQQITVVTFDMTRAIPKFAAYQIKRLEPVLRGIAPNTTLPILNQSDIGHLPFCLPSIPEQRAIAAFLDRETGRIDALIAKKERQIELLQEKRTALISHAVTKGLDPDAPMKDSGVEWLGEIPVGWAAGKTKYIATLRTGHTPSRQHPEYWRDCTIPWFSLADVWQLRDGRREYLGETKEKISTLGLANSSAELLPANTVIVSRTASVGFSGIMPEPMATTQDFVNWVCSPKIQPEYLLYVFRSMEHEFKRLTMGSTHKTIYMPDAASFQTPVPPIGEQKQIVKYVQKHKKSLEHVEDLVAVSIEKLREYRTALISAAVTGKIDVRSDET